MANMEVAMKAAKQAGAHVQGTIVYTISPYHSRETFVKTAKELVELGADSICIKDMAGLLVPYEASELVKIMKEQISVPLAIHT
ncbi:pyruvate/oxaloacetate carboxyltransferase, partial [Sporomusaceae bacterium BoRhaA]|nr:pyruvate/oxaloacetate carboxyltransferase [Pelorhabdus rhamnosifermentans]